MSLLIGATVLTAAQAGAQKLQFRALTRAECARYWDSGEPRDKAGAYAIQGLGVVFVSRLMGSYSGVMGLPLCETAELLDAAGVPRWQPLGPSCGAARSEGRG